MKTNSNSKKASEEGLKIGAGAVAGVAVGVAGSVAAQTVMAAEQTVESPAIVIDELGEESLLVGAEQESEAAEAAVAQASSGVECVEVIVNGNSYSVADVDQNGRVSVNLNVDSVVVSSSASEVEAEAVVEDQLVSPTQIDVQVDGDTIHIVDLDQDGIADLAAMDQNLDGYIDNSEVVDISEEGMTMADLSLYQEESYSEDLAHSNDVSMPDYVNDADVNEFMA